jgi:rhomboid protease GluP
VRDFHLFKLTYILIFLNVLIYLPTAFLSGDLTYSDGRVLVMLGALYGPFVLVYDEWWRLLTAIFLHGGMMHLAMNMFSLYIVGRSVEIYFGRRIYLTIYLFSGLIGAMASLYIHPESISIGASGAIFGIFGALTGLFFTYRNQIPYQSRAFMKDFLIIMAINVFLGLSIPEIDVSAHIGGLVTGVIGGVMLAKKPRWLWAYSAAMLSVLALSSVYLKSLHASVL